MVPDAETPRLTGRRGVTATDRLMIGFLLVNTAVVVWHAPVVGAWPWLLLANALTLTLIALLARAPVTGLVAFIGGGYGVLLSIVYYTQLGVIALDTAHVYDALVLRWEEAVFGGQVSVTWNQRVPSLVLSWIMHFCYGSYYWIVTGTGLWLYFRTPREAYERGTFLITLAFYTCYLIFAFLPVTGPREFFGDATGPITTVLPARFVHRVLEVGSAWGTAFPSSHVAASWMAVMASWRDARRLALVLAPVSFGLALGTVYGQIHYGVDAIAGAILAVALFAVGDRVRNALRPAAPW